MEYMSLLGFVFFSVLLMSNTATAQSSQNDVRCFLVSNIFAKAAKDPKARKLAEAGVYFYLGRIDGRVSGTQLKRTVREQSKALSAANASAVMAGCARFMQASAKSVRSLGGQLPQK